MLQVIVIVVILLGLLAVIKLSRQQKQELEELIVAPTVQAASCGSDRPRVRRFFDQTVMTIGEAQSALAAQANTGLERLAREVQVRPEEARSDRLLDATTSAMRTWVETAEQLDDEDIEDASARGVELHQVLQWNNRQVSDAAALNELLVLLNAVRVALRAKGWGGVPSGPS